MPLIKINTMSAPGVVRIRAKATDPHEGLRGHAYIAARGLNQPVQRLDIHASSRAAAALNFLTAPAPHHDGAQVLLLQKRRPA